MDIILYQRIGNRWEFRYDRNGDTYTGFGYDAPTARCDLFNKLGWEIARFNRAEFRRF